MKIVGLIVEYNPFHNGHLYHIEESLRITGADCAIVITSGDFVQRGAPAIMPKHLRAEMALRSGASIVIELPVCYATGSAEYFATGAVELLNSLGCVDSICFGSECGDLTALSQVADILLEEPMHYKEILQEHLRQGNAYPAAREIALEQYLLETASQSAIARIIKEPNNILGIEYVKALKKLHSNMKPYTITRKISQYHDQELHDTYSSASAIRKELLEQKTILTLSEQVPPWCYTLIESNYLSRFPLYNNDFSLLIRQKLLSETKETLLRYQDVTEELANRIVNLSNEFVHWNQFCDLVKTRNLTYSRVSRCLIHILLDIRNMDFVINHYIHILGFRKCDAGLFQQIKECSTLPLITKLAVTDMLSDTAKAMLEQDIYAANLYESVVTNRYNTPFIHEFKQSMVIL